MLLFKKDKLKKNSNKCCSLNFLFITELAQFLAKHLAAFLFEGSCDTEDWSYDAEKLCF